MMTKTSRDLRGSIQYFKSSLLRNVLSKNLIFSPPLSDHLRQWSPVSHSKWQESEVSGYDVRLLGAGETLAKRRCPSYPYSLIVETEAEV